MAKSESFLGEYTLREKVERSKGKEGRKAGRRKFKLNKVSAVSNCVFVPPSYYIKVIDLLFKR